MTPEIDLDALARLLAPRVAALLRRRHATEDAEGLLAELADLLDVGDCFTAESAAVRINADPDLCALAEAAGAKPANADATAYSVGYFLKNRAGTIVGPYALVRVNGDDRPALWRFK